MRSSHDTANAIAKIDGQNHFFRYCVGPDGIWICGSRYGMSKVMPTVEQAIRDCCKFTTDIIIDPKWRD
jgi:hypothetical protein